MNWINDLDTFHFLEENIPNNFVDFEIFIQQFGGRLMHLENWSHRFGPEDLGFFPDPVISSPENIIQSFQNGHNLVGLAQVVSWGTMWRTANRIYTAELEIISETLNSCYDNLIETNTIDGAWTTLSAHLNWSPVIISKVLHFLVRGLPEDMAINPPVPIDNKIILKKVWLTLVQGISPNTRPGNWKDGFEGYIRYMTFINFLRTAIYTNWTNTEIEATLFHHFYN
jgi:hypothetical protein